MEENKSYDFIVGNPRSGTTLLSLILNREEHAFVLLESATTKHIITDFQQTYRELRSTKKYLEKLLTNSQEIPIEIDRTLIKEVLKVKKESVKAQCVSIAQCLNFLGKPGKTSKFFIEKNPGYSFLVKELLAYFPEAKFIWLTRDYRAFASSRMEKRNHNKNSINTDLSGYIWNTYIKELARCRNLFEDRILLVKYEDLVINQKETVERICKFLGLNFSEEMLKVEQLEVSAKLEAETNRTKIKFGDLSKNIYTNRVNSWEENLTNDQIKRLDTICVGNEIYAPKNNIGIVYRYWIKLSRLPLWLNAKYFAYNARKI